MNKLITILFICLFTAACGGASGGSIAVKKNTVKSTVKSIDKPHCLANKRNCTDADVDLNAPVYWAADNGIKVVHIRWAGCCDSDKFFKASKYAFDRGVTVIWPAGDENKELKFFSPYMIVANSDSRSSNYPADVSIWEKGTIHSSTAATAYIVMLYKELAPSMDAAGAKLIRDSFLVQDHSIRKYPKWSANITVMIVDTGFDSRAEVMFKNTALAGETGDYGIKAVNEFRKWCVDCSVIGYVPFNSLPSSPRIDNWEIKT